MSQDYISMENGMLAEVAAYLERIEDIRGQVGVIVEGLAAEALNWRPVVAEDDHVTNSLAVMATHVAGAEHFWIGEVIGRQPPTRNRPREFETRVADSDQLLARLTAVHTQTRAILTNLRAADLAETRAVNGRIVPVRWAILHVIDHTSLHLGHMQITYQLWNHGQGIDAPRWFQRLK